MDTEGARISRDDIWRSALFRLRSRVRALDRKFARRAHDICNKTGGGVPPHFAIHYSGMLTPLEGYDPETCTHPRRVRFESAMALARGK